MKIKKFKTKFVYRIPKELEDGVLYVCIDCNVIVHKCACGCGEKTVTPIDKINGWVMKYDGQTVTLRPSIGNFSIPCNSHYYITENKVEWLEDYRCNYKKQSLWNKMKNFFKNGYKAR